MKRLLLAALCAATLSACGGGGGGTSSGLPSTPSPPAATPPIQTTSVQRADATQALTSYSGSQQATSTGVTGTVPATLRRHIEAAATRVTTAYRQGYRVTSTSRRAQSVPYSACSNMLESAVVTVSAGEEQLYERVFYDTACTKLYKDIFFDIIATSATAGSATGTATLYNLNGNVFDYETLSLTLSGVGTGSGSFSIVATDAPNASSPTIATLGIACSLSSSAVGCGIGAVARESGLSQDIGATVGVNATIPAATGGSTTVPVNGTASAYTGSLGALSLGSGMFPNFIVSGGSVADSATFNGSFTYTQTGTLAAASFALADAASDGTVTVSSSGTPPATTINGTVKRTSTGQVLATFTTDVAGNGTISYSNGSTGQILNWQVFG